MEKESKISSCKGVEQLSSKKVSWEDPRLPRSCWEPLKLLLETVQSEHQTRGWIGPGNRRGFGNTALFSGPSGTGKTLAAQLLSQELKHKLYRIDLGQLTNKYIGETEKNLSLIFEAAEKEQAILFFDEADALFGKRTEVKDTQSQYANQETNYLLTRIESFTGLVILAANGKQSLYSDPLQRLRMVVEFS